MTSVASGRDCAGQAQGAKRAPGVPTKHPAAKAAGAAHSTAQPARQRRGEAKRAERAPGV